MCIGIVISWKQPNSAVGLRCGTGMEGKRWTRVHAHISRILLRCCTRFLCARSSSVFCPQLCASLVHLAGAAQNADLIAVAEEGKGCFVCCICVVFVRWS